MSVFHTSCLNRVADDQYAENTKRNMGWPTIFICPQCSVHLASDYSIQKYGMKRSTSDLKYDDVGFDDDDDDDEFLVTGGRYKKIKSGKRNKSKKYCRNKKRRNTRRKKYKKN